MCIRDSPSSVSPTAAIVTVGDGNAAGSVVDVVVVEVEIVVVVVKVVVDCALARPPPTATPPDTSASASAMINAVVRWPVSSLFDTRPTYAPTTR